MKKIIYSVVFLLFSLFTFAQQMKLEIDGDITFNKAEYNIEEAGTDFSPTVKSSSRFNVSVSFLNYWDKFFDSGKRWRIDVNKSDVYWDPRLNIEIARTGNGSSHRHGKRKQIFGGTQFQPVLNNPGFFFRGQNEIYNIPIKFKISGISATLGAKELETIIVFTVYDD